MRLFPVVSFFLLSVGQVGVGGSLIAPFLSSSGNSSILVFLDLHRSYHGDTCLDVDWNIVELAYSVYWKSISENQTGIEIYDTCSSTRHVLDIIRRRLSKEPCSAQLPPVSGILSYSVPNINTIITANFDTIHVIVDNGETSRRGGSLSGRPLYVQLASKENTEILTLVLLSMNWTYVTALSDNSPESIAELQMFQRLAQRSKICIQYSQVVEQWTDQIPTLKTNSIVIFAKNLSGIKSLIESLSNTASVVVATPDRSTNEFQFLDSGLVLTDAFERDEGFSEFMIAALGDSTLQQYYIEKHGCSVINQSDSDGIECSNIEKIVAYFYVLTSSRLMQTFFKSLDLVKSITADMVGKNCTDYNMDCFDFETELSHAYFLGVEDDTLLSRPPYNVSVSLVSEGVVHKTDIVSSIDLTELSLNLGTWVNGSAPVPPSVCSTWCPSCHRTRCMSPSTLTTQFDGEYVFISGDILIVGMLPLSKYWDRTATSQVCTGIEYVGNYDIRAEAFLYAVMSLKDRQPGILRNTSIGALLFDTCSDANRASQILINFESCRYNFTVSGNVWRPLPDIVPAYVLVGGNGEATRSAKDLQKLALSVDDTGNLLTADGTLVNSSKYDFNAVLEFLKQVNISYVGVVTSEDDDNSTLSEFFQLAFSKDICIAYQGTVSVSNYDLLYTIRSSQANVVVVMATSKDVDTFFRSLTTQFVVKTWIVLESRKNWLDYTSFPLPRGSVIFGVQDKESLLFNQHIDDLLGGKSVNVTTNNPWIGKFNQSRLQAKVKSPLSDDVTYLQSSDIIKVVDLTVEAIGRASRSLCGNEAGLCPEFVTRGPETVLTEIEMSYPRKYQEYYVVYNLHETGLIEVGQWLGKQLVLDTEKLKSFDSKGNQLAIFRESYCFSGPCYCQNVNVSNNQSGTSEIKQLDYEMGFKDSTAKFEKELWTIIVVIIAGTGSFLTLVMMVYIMYKVCAGAHMRRYLALGILLLLGITFLFMSVLPFVFTPSESVCGMRYFAHGLSYAFCFAVMLSKMMTLRDYRYLGLGGDISRLNQFLNVFFITSVQIAIGVQWWMLRTPMVFTEHTLGVINEELRQITYYSCDFVRKDFIPYHSYVFFLIVLCCFYGLSVRNETKNMKEARLLLVSSWFTLAVWIAIIVTFMTLDRKYLEAICAIGLLANALVMVVIIYLPKLTAISRLRYDVAEQNVHKENGYKLDPDFMFERPYSLPGTLHNSVTDKQLTYPRSLATFDTSLSY